MSDVNIPTAPADDGASNLRAIFEILSYIHVDAQRDNYSELADRIEFSLNLAEKLIKSGKSGKDVAATPDASQPDVGTAALKSGPSAAGGA